MSQTAAEPSPANNLGPPYQKDVGGPLSEGRKARAKILGNPQRCLCSSTVESRIFNPFIRVQFPAEVHITMPIIAQYPLGCYLKHTPDFLGRIGHDQWTGQIGSYMIYARGYRECVEQLADAVEYELARLRRDIILDSVS